MKFLCTITTIIGVILVAISASDVDPTAPGTEIFVVNAAFIDPIGAIDKIIVVCFRN